MNDGHQFYILNWKKSKSLILVKILKGEDHIKDLKETFQVLLKFQMRRNPKKYTFGIQVAKFLGYIISEIGIQAPWEQVKAILDMLSSRNKKEIQKLIIG